MNVAVLSDTHVPSRATRIPAEFRERIAAADHVLHAGDFDAESTIDDVRELATELTAVKGNTDPRVGLPSVASVELGGTHFVVTHGAGSHHGYEDRVANAARQHGPDGTIAVAGHTHEVIDRVHDGVRILNPGSATGATPAARATMMTAELAAGDVDVTVHEL